MTPSPKAPAAKLLSNASRELRALRIMIERLEAAAYTLLTKTDGDHTHEIIEIQQLDHLMQTIMNIANFIDNIVETIPDEIDVDERDAINAISLRALAERLAINLNSLSAGAAPVAGNDDAGECSFFDD